LTLIDISIESSSCSQARNNFSRAVTDGANNKMSSAYNTTNVPYAHIAIFIIISGHTQYGIFIIIIIIRLFVLCMQSRMKYQGDKYIS